MKKRLSVLAAVFLAAAMTFQMTGCSDLFEEKDEYPNNAAQTATGDYDKTSFTSSKFTQIRDCFWETQSNPTILSNTKNPYDADAKSILSWQSGDYVSIEKIGTINSSDVYNSGIVFGEDAGGKTVPLYRVTYHHDSTTKVIASNMVILGISEYGIFTISRRGGTEDWYYGTFYYTTLGWSSSSNGSSSLSVTMDVVYPTEAEINDAISKY